MRNIFYFAPSELSQDAMIAWLMECARSDDEILREVGRAFIRFLLDRPLRCADGSIIKRAVIASSSHEPTCYSGSGLVTNVPTVEKQYKHIDVYCRAKIDGKHVSFVVEDKTGTKAHSDQLQRYRDKVRTDKFEEDYFKLIYFKTGMPYKDELHEAAKSHYCHVDVRDLNDFLSGEIVTKAAKSSDLIDQYREHINKQAEAQYEARADWDMDWGPIQLAFAEDLKCRTAEINKGYHQPGDEDKADVIWNARNRGGTCWTQYRFLGWHLFWRMDSGHGQHLRMMVDVRHRSPATDVETYRKQFVEACAGVTGIEPERLRHRAGREMTVGAIPYPAGERKIGKEMAPFLKQVTQVHERFLKRVAAGS